MLNVVRTKVLMLTCVDWESEGSVKEAMAVSLFMFKKRSKIVKGGVFEGLAVTKVSNPVAVKAL